MKSTGKRLIIAVFMISFCIFFASPSVLLAQRVNFLNTPNGSDKVFLKTTPWSGYWWERKGGYLFKGWNGHPESPLTKYDKYVSSRSGKNPGAVAWEKDSKNKHYTPRGNAWGGHCNGWSAASILEPEPKAPRTVGGITFTVADQKGILSELYMDTYFEFYGTRSNSYDYVDQDIYPDLFHRLLVENLKVKNRAIVADIDPEKPVWNFPITGYETTWEASYNKARVYFTTKIYYIDDKVNADFVGVKWFAKTYYYTLYLNEKGEVTGGIWNKSSKSSHPDFIWIPTADAPASINENPCLDTKFVHEITGNPIPTPVPQPPTNASGTIRTVRTNAVLIEAGVDISAL
ncbi:MAG: hypothetical protein HQM10_20500 [Candidatus Riflebacteria bacterium]|nr:hypothetical protein [Candidatus Riflebacteria bacterium]